MAVASRGVSRQAAARQQLGSACVSDGRAAFVASAARVLNVPTSGDGCFQNDRYVITWCIGHLVELDEPADYNPQWKRWSLDTLPMLPERFGLDAVSEWVRDLTRGQRADTVTLDREEGFPFLVAPALLLLALSLALGERRRMP